MSQADVTKLVSKLRYTLGKRRKLKTPGVAGRHEKIRKTVTALIKHERIELNQQRGDESRGYAERLISDAIRYGDCHKETMEMASYWLLEKQLVHKLFKVLVPRFKESPLSYTNIIKAPRAYPGMNFDKCVLELRNNIYPPLIQKTYNNRNLIHNILLDEARKEFRKEKYTQPDDNIEVDEQSNIAECFENLDLNKDEDEKKS